MLLGHWYLIDTGQSLDPFIRIYKFFVGALVVQTIFLLLSVIALHMFGESASVIGLRRLWMDHLHTLPHTSHRRPSHPFDLVLDDLANLGDSEHHGCDRSFYIALLGVFVEKSWESRSWH